MANVEHEEADRLTRWWLACLDVAGSSAMREMPELMAQAMLRLMKDAYKDGHTAGFIAGVETMGEKMTKALAGSKN